MEKYQSGVESCGHQKIDSNFEDYIQRINIVFYMLCIIQNMFIILLQI